MSSKSSIASSSRIIWAASVPSSLVYVEEIIVTSACSGLILAAVRSSGFVALASVALADYGVKQWLQKDHAAKITGIQDTRGETLAYFILMKERL